MYLYVSDLSVPASAQVPPRQLWQLMESASKKAVTPSSVVQEAATALEGFPQALVDAAAASPDQNFHKLLTQDGWSF